MRISLCTGGATRQAEAAAYLLIGEVPESSLLDLRNRVGTRQSDRRLASRLLLASKEGRLELELVVGLVGIVDGAAVCGALAERGGGRGRLLVVRLGFAALLCAELGLLPGHRGRVW
jgi:hypothetical protein